MQMLYMLKQPGNYMSLEKQGFLTFCETFCDLMLETKQHHS